MTLSRQKCHLPTSTFGLSVDEKLVIDLEWPYYSNFLILSFQHTQLYIYTHFIICFVYIGLIKLKNVGSLWFYSLLCGETYKNSFNIKETVSR